MEITREKAIQLLKSFSAMEGFLFSIRGSSELFEAYITPSIDMLTEIILEKETNNGK